MMSAIAPGQFDPVTVVDHVADREKLQENLLAAVKLCHVRFGGRMELATESDQCVSRLCHAFEVIFRHGLKVKTTEKLNSAIRHVSELVSGSGGMSRTSVDFSFWPCIKEQLTWHEQERFAVLRNVHTDFGRGKAWLRAALNERSLERHLHAIINASVLLPYYEDWAFLLDQERSSVLPNVAAGLGTIVFAIRIDNDELDDRSGLNESMNYRVSQSEPIINSIINTQKSKRKKVPTNIISFDNDDEEDEGQQDRSQDTGVSTSAPATLALQLKKPENDVVSLEKSSQSGITSTPVLLDVKANWIQNEMIEEERVLTPLTDIGGIGGLMPVSPLDQALDDMLVALPSYMHDNGIPEHAVEATEPLTGIDSHLDADKLDIDALRVRLLAMGEILEQTREDAVTSRLQLARFQRQHQNYLERHEVQLQALNRENELLRQQLRKYVTAVQMLKRDSDVTTLSDEEQSLDCHSEAQQYQEKLVQVAEMHAELMEFNSRLTMQLSSRDKLVKRLQAELECLRGPLGDGDIPIDSQYLIHIWIPSAFLTGQNTDVHHVYQIYVRIRNSEWNLYRRYAQFHSLYKDLKKHDPIVSTFEFPPKKTIGNKDAKFVEDRR